MKKIFFFILTLFVASSCTTEKISIHVSNLKETRTIVENPIIYALPKTVVTVKVTAKRKVTQRGIFSDYAYKYLGIPNVIKKNTVFWEINDIKFDQYALPDTSNYYVVNTNGSGKYVNLTPEGLIASIHSKQNIQNQNRNEQQDLFSTNSAKNHQLNSNIFIQKTMKIKMDTIYKEIQEDSIFIRVPIVRKQLVKKSIEDQAQELANQILTLRDDRNAIIIGDGYSEDTPDGKSLEVMINELNKLEAKYLSLFTGQYHEKEFTYYFQYEPISNTKLSQHIIFRFSQTRGILDRTDIKAHPVIIEIASTSNTDVIHNFWVKQEELRKITEEKLEQNGFYYRNPAQANVRIILDGDAIAEQKMLIAQYGTLGVLPAILFQHNDVEVEFYPEYGSIKSISKK